MCSRGMRKKGKGLIINISSVGALFPIPYQSMYVASKAAVELMSGSLRNELRAVRHKGLCGGVATRRPDLQGTGCL